MSLIQLEINQDALARAMRLGGHRTASEAVAAALEEYNRIHAQDAVSMTCHCLISSTA
ncbi:type II toxin-antitoxin system VapB family antitoxin [Nocardia sp. NPDC058658]|uniref:type II toxin-antitoxin system VapB family antitoxin n=1 Tax=Nocardia sp. NPDC058658 TaxID=3346580 RepID=UPI0036638615